MKTFVPLFLVLTISLWAADFWQSKPFTEWNDKEVQKMETSSPWSKQVSIGMGEAGGSGRGGRGSRAGGGGSVGGDDTTVSTGAGGSGGGRSEDIGALGGASLTITVSWRTALPVRQAVAKMKYPGDAISSPDAREIIEEEQKYYGILVSGLPGGAGRGGDRMKDALMKNTTLSVKGKDPIQVADIQTGGNEQKPVILFLFPRGAALSVDDKDVEFSTRLGPLMVKQRFHLKDMVFNGKLEL
jgi:hypothetical protein